MEEDNSDVKKVNIMPRLIEDEMKSSYLDYAMSVIVGRALPDIRDGLKPVHRRILYAMSDLGMFHNKPYKKSARIVGEVLGKYHPHGDSAVYDSAVRMTQEFSLRYPLIAGQGNFGSVDGDNAAAMRYTEARLAKISEDLLADIDKDTVDFVPNFDGSLEEPSVIPSKLPNLLINGSSGIAVGMATNIPPHNLSEITDGIIELIDNPEATTEDLMKHVKGPDFPTGGVMMGTAGVRAAYERGRGKVVIRAKAEIEEVKGREQIIIHELPYQVNKAQLIEHIADLVKNGTFIGISDIRDESDKDGMRIVIELKQNVPSNILLNQLFRHTRLETSFGIILLSLVDNVPKVLGLKDMMSHFILHRRTIVRRRTAFELKKAEDKAHILEGLIIALDDIDNVIQKIKKSRDVEAAKQVLISDYSLSESQAKAILDMRLQKLSSLEREKITEEHKRLTELVAELKSILSSEPKMLEIIKSELAEMKEKYGDGRRTDIEVGDFDQILDEDLIPEEEMVVTITHAGYIKRVPSETYKAQGRGGKGIVGTTSKDDDFVEHIFVASTHDYVLFFTNKGKVYWKKVYELPSGSRQAKGKAIVNLIRIDPGERVTAFVPVKEFADSNYLLMATKKGVVKKTSLEAFSRPRQGGIIGISLNDEDELIEVIMTDGNTNVVIATAIGSAIRFKETDVRPMGRSASGVRGIKLRDGDSVVGMVRGEDEKYILTITENGYGKRTSFAEYRVIGRGGLGVKNIICSERNGNVVAVRSVTDEDDVMFISKKGVIIRTSVQNISKIGRATQGFRLMSLKNDDKVGAAARIINE